MYQHLDVQSQVDNDRVAWDAAPLDYNRSTSHQPPKPEKDEISEDEESMDTSDLNNAQVY